MKKLLAVLAVIMIASLSFLSGCAAAGVRFVEMSKILSSKNYERCVYGVEISSGLDDEKEVYTAAGSEMVLTFEKLEGTLAKLTAETTVTFVKTPPYADPARDYGGLTDRMYSEVVFNAYSEEFTPVSVKKSADLETSRKYDEKDKSFAAEFVYPAGKQAGTGKYKPAGGAEEAFTVSSGKLKNAFDSEQVYYMISSFLGTDFDADLNIKLGYAKQYKIFNLADYLAYGTTAADLAFTVAAEQTDGYNGLSAPGKDKFAQVTMSFPKGQPLFMYYSLDYVIKIPGRDGNPQIRRYLLLGYEQDTLLRGAVTKTSYTLKDYSTVK